MCVCVFVCDLLVCLFVSVQPGMGAIGVYYNGPSVYYGVLGYMNHASYYLTSTMSAPPVRLTSGATLDSPLWLPPLPICFCISTGAGLRL